MPGKHLDGLEIREWPEQCQGLSLGKAADDLGLAQKALRL